tara:strand:- start:192 stop:377 length:186 start_codon:yes stop_codon:yes gene_type:complete
MVPTLPKLLPSLFPFGKALNPHLLLELWSLPGAPAAVRCDQPVVDAIALAILFPVVLPSKL